MTTVFKGWGGAWGDSWGTVVFDPNAMIGSAALHFTAAGVLSSTGTATGAMEGAATMVFGAQATGTAVVVAPAKPRSTGSGYGRTGKQHGRRWRLPDPTHHRTRHEREREDLIALFGR